jgi:actin-like ATPase involved in cell morphogenesis
MTSYWLGIDVGTTYTAAAICRPGADGLEVQVVPLSNHSHAIPSVLFLPGDGSLLVGEGAQRRSLTDPDRVVREFKSRIGDEIPLRVGGSPYYAHDLAAEFVSWLYRYVIDREGERPEGVALTCPASWGPYKTGLFERAVRDAGVDDVTLLSEPQAAAISYAGRERVEVGATLAVYDLGGGTFDAAVVRKDSPTSFTVLGQPEGIEGLGGVTFDEAVFEHVCSAAGVPLAEIDADDPDLVAEVARLRRECTEAKEALSADTDTTIPVTLGDIRQRIRLTRAELEEMIRPDLNRTIEAMRRGLGSAGVDAADLDAILLIGGSSRIPLVSQLIAAEFGRAPAIDADPNVAVAMGAARFPAPASAPVRDTVVTPIQSPRTTAPPIAPPERPEMVSMPVPGDHGAGGQSEAGTPVRRRSRKTVLGAVAVAVLVLAGVTALRTPVLSDLLAHHSSTTHGITTSKGSTPGSSASPAPSAGSSPKPTRPAGTVAKTGTSDGPSSAASASRAVAAVNSAGKQGSKGTTGGKSSAGFGGSPSPIDSSGTGTSTHPVTSVTTPTSDTSSSTTVMTTTPTATPTPRRTRRHGGGL